jgi:hypothetical protein
MSFRPMAGFQYDYRTSLAAAHPTDSFILASRETFMQRRTLLRDGSVAVS